MQTLKISGLTCGACQKIITKRIMKIKGVKEVKVELNGRTEIDAERNISKEEIMKVLEDTEFKIL
ncbi:heavy-metal-associated domain-containing protein [Patescibacteria group bacterium]|nr:heavy-metal-associated domain-containing protein [Patescibacteria group bacterium]MBU4016607.1 heavy-metal-associated domain-containing protein [Patescibacteria group bacterium]MBU4098368.1 heavy-metal-associated domain-containing protein [Patescibacteria group bacterium]